MWFHNGKAVENEDFESVKISTSSGQTPKSILSNLTHRKKWRYWNEKGIAKW